MLLFCQIDLLYDEVKLIRDWGVFERDEILPVLDKFIFYAVKEDFPVWIVAFLYFLIQLIVDFGVIVL